MENRLLWRIEVHILALDTSRQYRSRREDSQFVVIITLVAASNSIMVWEFIVRPFFIYPNIVRLDASACVCT
jgi:hypothetical protein